MAVPAKRRDVILDQAAKLFASKGIAGTTVREIADTVGILSGSLYHHFDSKDAIVDELLRAFLQDLRRRYRAVAALDLRPRAHIEALVRASMETVETHPYATKIYQNEFNLLRDQPSFRYLRTTAREVQKTWTDALQAGRDDGTFRTDIDQQTIYRIMRDVVWLSVRWHRPGPGRRTLSQLADDCSSLLLDGIAVRSSAHRPQ